MNTSIDYNHCDIENRVVILSYFLGLFNLEKIWCKMCLKNGYIMDIAMMAGNFQATILCIFIKNSSNPYCRTRLLCLISSFISIDWDNERLKNLR